MNNHFYYTALLDKTFAMQLRRRKLSGIVGISSNGRVVMSNQDSVKPEPNCLLALEPTATLAQNDLSQAVEDVASLVQANLKLLCKQLEVKRPENAVRLIGDVLGKLARDNVLPAAFSSMRALFRGSSGFGWELQSLYASRPVSIESTEDLAQWMRSALAEIVHQRVVRIELVDIDLVEYIALVELAVRTLSKPFRKRLKWVATRDVFTIPSDTVLVISCPPVDSVLYQQYQNGQVRPEHMIHQFAFKRRAELESMVDKYKLFELYKIQFVEALHIETKGERRWQSLYS